MNIDPIDRLRDELVAAGERRLVAGSHKSRRRRHRLPAVIAGAVALAVVPVAASLTRVLDSDSGTLPTGKTYTVEQPLPSGAKLEASAPTGENGRFCRLVRILRNAGRDEAFRMRTCEADEPGEVIRGSGFFMTLVGDGVLVIGSVPDAVVKVEVSGAPPPALRPFPDSARRTFVALSTDESPQVTAFGANGQVVARRVFEYPQPSHPPPAEPR